MLMGWSSLVEWTPWNMSGHSLLHRMNYTNTPNACPCNTDTEITIPPWVGDEYFCETGVPTGSGWITNEFYFNNLLWDGQQCGGTSTCCDFNNPPYFCKQLLEAITDDIEVRICGDELLSNEDTPVELIEVFIQ